ncbi:thioredoxin family protein [Porphyromonadaceae bacterium]
MKLKKWVLYFFVLFLTTAAVSKDAKPGEGLSEGSVSPDLTLMTSGFMQTKLSDYKGKYVLLQFWASNNADSRISNVKLNNLIKADQDASVKMISLALDKSSEVARMTAELDGIDPSNIFTVSDVLKEEVKKQFRMNSVNYGNFLLNEDGVIIAKNLTTDDMKKIVFN